MSLKEPGTITLEGGGFIGVNRSNVIRDAGAVFSRRGDDFLITVGGDLSVGYRGHDTPGVHLFCALFPDVLPVDDGASAKEIAA